MMPMPTPKNVLRIVVNFCLVGAGGSAIYQVSHVGPGYDRLGWIHDLTIFFFYGLATFGLFFGEYEIVQRLSKVELNGTWGYVQSLGCFLLFLSGIGGIYYSHVSPLASHAVVFQDGILQIILVFGHLIFLGNIIWSYINEGNAA